MKAIKQTIFNDIKLPEVLYKFRSWHNPDHKKILTEREIYFSSPFQLDEQHECLIEIDRNYITDENVYKYFDLKTPQDRFLSINERDDYIKNLVMNSPIRNEDHIKMVEKESRKHLNDTLSIFCGSESNDNLNLWRTFGDDLEGFCVGFDTKKMFNNSEIFGSGGPVSYSEFKLKPFYLREDERLIDMANIIFNLDKKFEREKEYRLTKFHMENKQVKLHPAAFRELIIGPKMDEKNREEILDVARKNFTGITLIQANFYEDLGTFSFKPI